MDAWYGLLALVVLTAVLKLYAWCQMRYWDSPVYRKDWKPGEMGLGQKQSAVDSKGERRDA